MNQIKQLKFDHGLEFRFYGEYPEKQSQEIQTQQIETTNRQKLSTLAQPSPWSVGFSEGLEEEKNVNIEGDGKI